MRRSPITALHAIALAAVLAGATIAAVATADARDRRGDDNTRPAVIAVKFHADWCGSCKTLGPVMRDLGNKHDGAPVLFVTLDLTNETTSRQAKFLAGALGLGGVYAKHAPKTGYVLLIDARTKRVRAKLDKTMTFKQMSAALKRTIAATK